MSKEDIRNIPQSKKTPAPKISQKDDFFSNFEWGPYQSGSEDQRDVSPIQNNGQKSSTPSLSPKEEFFSNFEWGPYQSGSEDQREG